VVGIGIRNTRRDFWRWCRFWYVRHC